MTAKRNTTVPTGTLAELWTKSRIWLEAANWAAIDDYGCEAAFAMEAAILRGPIQSHEDAIAKLRVVELSFRDGERTDGAEIEAIGQITEWLAAQAAGQAREIPGELRQSA